MENNSINETDITNMFANILSDGCRTIRPELKSKKEEYLCQQKTRGIHSLSSSLRPLKWIIFIPLKTKLKMTLKILKRVSTKYTQFSNVLIKKGTQTWIKLTN